MRSKSISIALLFCTLSFILVLSLQSCKTDSDQLLPESIHLRIAADPERINPMLSRSGYATQVEDLIFSSLLYQNPYNLEIEPMLAESMPHLMEGPTINGQETIGYTFTIKEDAVWDDGSPVTAFDYIFTKKLALNPYVPAASWKNFLNFLQKIEIHSDNDKRLTVYADKDFILSMEISGTFAIYPEYHYDPKGIMRAFDYQSLKNYQEGDFSPEQEEVLKSIAESFTSARFNLEEIRGSGPYQLTAYETGQRISLNKKQGWWGEDLLQIGPKNIHFFIIPDESTALSALKEGSIHLMSEVSPTYFRDLMADESMKNQFNFHTPPLLQLYYLAMNNHHHFFSDIHSRKAMAKLLDNEFLIQEVMEGFAQPLSTILHPSSPYFHNGLKPIEMNLSAADSLLKLAGWTDSDGDGVRDKFIDGKKTDFHLIIDVSGGEIGKQTALIFKDAAEKIGIKVTINQREFRLIRQDLANRNYQLTPLVLRQNTYKTDLFQNWHSEAARPGGNNVSGFSNPEVDDLIMKIRQTEDEDDLKVMYRRVQEIIYEEQPVILMMAPTERLVVSKQFDLLISAKQPGYILYTARKAG